MIEIIKEQLRENRRGSVLGLAAIMLVILSVTGLGLLRLGFHSRMQAVRTKAGISARAAADAGFTKAMYEMNKNLNIKPWNFSNITLVGDRVLSNANADYTYTIEEIEKDSEYKITSIGRSGRAEKTVSATVRAQSLFNYAALANGYAIPKRPKAPKRLPERPKPLKKGGKIEIKNYNVEGYSSDSSQPYSGNLQIRTNSGHKRPVKIRENVVIHGDVIVGPGGNPNKVISKRHDAVITGATYAAAERLEAPSVTVPQFLDNHPIQEYEYKEGVPIAGNVRYDTLTLLESEVQKINGNCAIYVEGDIKIEEDAELILTKNSSVAIYVGGKLEVKKNSGGITNETMVPKNLVIYGTDTCRKIKIENANHFYGAVYAPLAKVEIKNSGDLYGAFVGWDVKLKKKKGEEHGTIYYDESLRSEYMTAADNGVGFVIRDWREQ